MNVSVLSKGRAGRGAAAADVRVLQLSMRRVHDLVAFCLGYELEDVVSEVTDADRIEVEDFGAVERARRAYKLVRRFSGSRRVARRLTPPLQGPRLSRDYDLFFPVFNHAFELFALSAVPDWRARCRRSACFIVELWADELPEYLLELLSGFDHVFVGSTNAVEAASRVIGAPCSYLPLAVDVLRFSPLPEPPPRSIDVCNIGRRSLATHAALVRLARERRIFYYYDTVRASGPGGKQVTFRVNDPAEHRMLFSSVLQRSRYYFANRARVNEPDGLGAKEELSARFYEGAAAGTVLIGEPPRSEEFRRQFDWPDAVVHVPFDCPDIADVLARLDSDPARIERIRAENLRQAALRHDWTYRLRTVFERVGLSPTPEMLRRESRLHELAQMAASPEVERAAPATAASYVSQRPSV